MYTITDENWNPSGIADRTKSDIIMTCLAFDLEPRFIDFRGLNVYYNGVKIGYQN
jgi:hypothetical protein